MNSRHRMPVRRARHLKTSVCIAAIVLGASAGNVQACVSGPNANELVCSGDQSDGVKLTLGTVGVVDVDDTDNYPAAGTPGTVIVKDLTSEIHPILTTGISITRGLSILGIFEGVPTGYAPLTVEVEGADIATVDAIGVIVETIGGTNQAGGDIDVSLDAQTTINTRSFFGIETSLHGVFVNSVGGRGENGGTDFIGNGDSGDNGQPGGNVTIDSSANITTDAEGSAGLFGRSQAGHGGDGGDSDTIGSGGDGGLGGDNADVEVKISNYGTIITKKGTSSGIIVQNNGSYGGDGGSGGFIAGGGGDGQSGGNGGLAEALNNGQIETDGFKSHGVFVQSVGGFGGDGGSSAALVGYGGNGASAGNGGQLIATNNGDISTKGAYAKGIFAQSVGGGGGAGGDADGIVALGGIGSVGGYGGDVKVINTGTIETASHDADGIFAQSVGGTGGDGGDSGGLVSIGGSSKGGGDGGTVEVSNLGTVTTKGNLSHAILAQSVGGGGGTGGFAGGVVSVGGSAADAPGGNGDTVTVSLNGPGSVATLGDDAIGVFAQSVGGGGGHGGSAVAVGAFVSFAMGGAGGAGGDAGDVSVNDCGVDGTGTADCSSHAAADAPTGTIVTTGDRSHGIQAQSIGGGGGSGGFSASLAIGPAAASVAIGGSGGDGGAAGAVDVVSDSQITTGGFGAHGIMAESIGGGGGTGGFAGSLSISEGISASLSVGGSGGSGGTGKAVTIEASGDILTTGDNSYGILAHSIGGGGGTGGFSFSASLSGVASLGMAIGGDGGDGQDAGSATVTNQRSVTTQGHHSHGIVAQSVGGGGGSGGFSVAGSGSGGVAGALSLGGSGESGGNGAAASITSQGAVITQGDHSFGLMAQSVGGGGGAGGFSVSGTFGSVGALGVDVGGSGGGGADASTASVTSNGNVQTEGDFSHAIVSQSIGGGGGSGGFSIGVAISESVAGAVNLGGSGGKGGSASTAMVAAAGTVATHGHQANGVLAQSIGGGGGNGGFAISAALSGDVSLGFGMGGSGAMAGDGDVVTVTTDAMVMTTGDVAHAIVAQSIGGGGGNGGFSVDANLTAGPVAAGAAVGGSGDGGGDAKAVNVTARDSVVATGRSSSAIVAQSIGGGGGNGGFAGSLSGALGDGAAASVSVGGSGGGGGEAGDVMVFLEGSDAVTGTSNHHAIGVVAQSVGGGGGNGGLGLSLSMSTESQANIGVAVGGSGGGGAAAGKAGITSEHTIITEGDHSTALLAQSLGGGGGNGGLAVAGALSTGASSTDVTVGVGGSGGGAGNADTAAIVSSGNISTQGKKSAGIHAQSIGGGGGNGGLSIAGSFSVAEGSRNLGVSVGGSGGGGGTADAVTVTHTGQSVQTQGEDAHGIWAQSIGGGGGNGGISVAAAFSLGDNSANLSASIGGSGGDGQTSSTVDVTAGGAITTHGTAAIGIYAQSIGGGGGTGGASFTGTAGTGQTGNVNFSLGGSGGDGADSDIVTVKSSAAITTYGAKSHGVSAKSVGGGGGDGGLAFSGSVAAAASGDSSSTSLSASIGGSGDGGGDGSGVVVTNNGNIRIEGEKASGLRAQSVGGGGGSGGLSLSARYVGDQSRNVDFTLGGSGAGGGNGGMVELYNVLAETAPAGSIAPTITTLGHDSDAIFAQSVGGGGGDGGVSGAVEIGSASQNTSATISVGGQGGGGGDGGKVIVNNDGALFTLGQESNGIAAQSVGGGGGDGGSTLSFIRISNPTDSDNKNINVSATVGGNGGSGGTGGVVEIDNTGAIHTTDHLSNGIFAQSVGGGGGTGGSARSMFVVGSIAPFASFPGVSSGENNTTLNMGVAVGGDGGDGNFAGQVQVTNTADILTEGADAYGIIAQSVGGGGGVGGAGDFGLPKNLVPTETIAGEATDDFVEVAESISAAGGSGGLKAITISVGGSGGSANDGGEVIVNNGDKALNDAANVMTLGDGSIAILAQSVGGGGGIAGTADIGTTGKVGIAQLGGGGGDGKAVTVNQFGDISTYGTSAVGIFAQSVGGGGGKAGAVQRGFDDIGLGLALSVGSGGASGDGGAVNVTSEGVIMTAGSGATGILAQSIGGGGGVGQICDDDLTNGPACAGGGGDGSSLGTGIGISFAGSSGGSGSAGDVTVSHIGSIIAGTDGSGGDVDGAYGVFAQSSGGTSGGNVAISTTGEVMTFGDSSHALYAQSSGTSDVGNVTVTHTKGDLLTTGAGSHIAFAELTPLGDNTGLSTAGKTAKVELVSPDEGVSARTSGEGSHIAYASAKGGDGAAPGGDGGAAGDVVVNSEYDLITEGEGSRPVLAESLGGNGEAGSDAIISGADGSKGGNAGASGKVTVTTSGSIETSGTGSTAVEARSIAGTVGAGGMGLGSGADGADGDGAASGDVSIVSTAQVITLGDDAHGLVAESSSPSGAAGAVGVSASGNVLVRGLNADAISALSSGASGQGNITVEFDGDFLVGGTGSGVAVRMDGGQDNSFTNHGSMSALSGNALVATTGNDTVSNFGLFAGNFDLGSGTNSFGNNAGAMLYTGETADLGGGTLTNDGMLSPGGRNVIVTTQVTGDFVQTETGELELDLRLGDEESDLILISGTASVHGEIQPFLEELMETDVPITVLTADGGVTDAGLDVRDLPAVDYSAVIDGNNLQISARPRFDEVGTAPGDAAMGDFFDRILNAGAATPLDDVMLGLANITNTEELDAALSSLNPEPYLVQLQNLVFTSHGFGNNLMSCATDAEQYGALREGECYWGKLAATEVIQHGDSDTVASHSKHFGISGGVQYALDDVQRLGLAFGYQRSDGSARGDTSFTGNTFQAGAVYKYQQDNLLGAVGVYGGYNWNDYTRRVATPALSGTAEGDQDQGYLSARIRAAMVHDVGAFYVKPVVDVDFTFLHTFSISETGVGAVNAVADDHTQFLATATPALEFGGEIDLADGGLIRSWTRVGAIIRSDDEVSVPFTFAGAPDGVSGFVLSDEFDQVAATVGVGFDILTVQGISIG
ncbi:MAG: autotransporter outer membrane beta-barrel domain-containing protein, partial [Pseudomonadota bacterium]